MAEAVLSCFQARALLAAMEAGGQSARCSPDLGLSEAEVRLTSAGAEFPGGPVVARESLRRIAADERKCFLADEAGIHDILVFSETTGWVRSLCPTSGAPTMLVSGIPMHRIKGTDPWADTVAKVRTVRPIVGSVLDTATGLGYTAIEAAKSAERVVTIELDPAALEVARHNPWSRGLFSNPKIEQVVGDTLEVVPEFEAGSFSRILHDPPSITIGGGLYSAGFYSELLRVLSRGGKLFHYVGDPESGLGERTTRGVMRRLGEVGFRRVQRRPEAFGVVAEK